MLGGERGEVTLLFSDLRNFTRYSEKTPPETVVQLLNAHFDAMVDLITAHGGFVVDFLGDGLFAVFGAPVAQPAHARQALRCALQMQLTRRRLNQEHAAQGLPGLEMGIGLNTGVCVVGNMGCARRIKYGVVGHAVNLAARVETFTVGGQVFLAEATWRAAGEDVVLAGPYAARGKGLEGPLQIWEARGWRSDPDLTLPPLIPRLTPLLPPLPVTLRPITGKEVSQETFPGVILQLSLAGAELAADLPLEIFATLNITLPLPAAPPASVDAKVLAPGEAPGSWLVKFSGLEAAAAAALEPLLIGG
jgi:adenylate cyclase